ncbi:MAG TPA: hypothetical protein VJ761_05345 [Ktedonobacteraceae bacterium]|nr:hypothetical protein [Ktedonobacteraceae bacterium]
MDYTLVLVPPGGGEADYQVDIHNARYIPRVGEYIILPEENELGCVRAFRVLYVTAGFVSANQPGSFQEAPPVVQAEFIRHPYQSKNHAASIAMYERRGKVVADYPESGY